ncbi:hypothetical protein AVEN_264622-1 [Araneus ventricosus]|uniref:Uncharacterized protein n=1 Tax=Araneus ventricosus TaxID=182803 RepID=A0A4Y2KAI6_ARAVE|nr:hypothetical protein AVEN_264622-1 [Araneus ventricosus]
MCLSESGQYSWDNMKNLRNPILHEVIIRGQLADNPLDLIYSYFIPTLAEGEDKEAVGDTNSLQQNVLRKWLARILLSFPPLEGPITNGTTFGAGQVYGKERESFAYK